MRLIAVTLGLALLSLAFAPAPFPKAARRGRDDEMSLGHFQGKWTHVRIETVGPNGERSEWKNADIVAVRVKGDQWTYLAPNDRVNSTYSITVKEARGPAAIDWYSEGPQGRPFMLGLVKRDGDRVQILGRMGVGPDERPRRFEEPPVGWWLMTLQRAR